VVDGESLPFTFAAVELQLANSSTIIVAAAIAPPTQVPRVQRLAVTTHA
jgi:hypothetical protein